MVDKPKTPESLPAEPEAVKIVKEVREEIDTLAVLGEFEKTEVGQEILGGYGLESIAEAFEDEEVFYIVINHLNTLRNDITSTHYRAFLIMADEQYPDFIAEALENDEDFNITDPKTLEIVLQLLKDRGHEVSPGLPEEVSAEKPKISETELFNLKGYLEMCGVTDHQIKKNVIEDFVMLKEFEQSAVGKEILAAHGLTSIFEIFTDKSIYDTVTTRVFELLGELDEFADDSVEKQGLYFIVNQPQVTSKLPERRLISPMRHLLTHKHEYGVLPAEVIAIVGDHASFREAMEDEEAFERFVEKLEQLKESINSELLNEMLIVSAEMSDEVDQFLKDYNADSWNQAMQNYETFKDFMKGWFVQINECIEPPESVHALLITAAKASKENAQWFLDKAERDESGEMREEPAYKLRETLGDEAFERVMETAKQTLEIPE